jgi:hypothetical protein
MKIFQKNATAKKELFSFFDKDEKTSAIKMVL